MKVDEAIAKLRAFKFDSLGTEAYRDAVMNVALGVLHGGIDMSQGDLHHLKMLLMPQWQHSPTWHVSWELLQSACNKLSEAAQS